MNKVKLLGVSLLVLGFLSGCSNQQAQNNNQISSQVSSQKNQKTLPEFKVSVAEAIAFYQAKYPNTDLTNLELEKELDHYVYKVEGADDNTEYEVKFDANDKKIYHEKSERLDYDEQNGIKRKEDKLDLTNLLDLKTVMQTALKEATSGEFESLELNKELATTYYEVNFKNYQQEISVKLNAKDGTILEKEIDD